MTLNYEQVNLTGLVTGYNIMVLVPNANSAKPYNPANHTPLLMYHHGTGEDEGGLLDDTLKAATTTALLEAGYICCGIAAVGNNWGNQASLDAYVDLYNTVKALYNLSYTLFLGQSMGGLSSLLSIARGDIPKIIAWAGIYPATNLTDIYAAERFAPSINAAYGCNSITFAEKTIGHDPTLKIGTEYRRVPMRFYASDGDTQIVKSYNSDEFSAIVSPYCSESAVVVCSGDHGNPSHFQPADLVAFYERALADPIRFGRKILVRK